MWRAHGFHIGRECKDYPALQKLRLRYKITMPPIEDLRKAYIEDGFPKATIDTLEYKPLPDIETLLYKKSPKGQQYKEEIIPHGHEELEPLRGSENASKLFKDNLHAMD